MASNIAKIVSNITKIMKKYSNYNGFLALKSPMRQAPGRSGEGREGSYISDITTYYPNGIYTLTQRVGGFTFYIFSPSSHAKEGRRIHFLYISKPSQTSPKQFQNHAQTIPKPPQTIPKPSRNHPKTIPGPQVFCYASTFLRRDG